VEAVRKFQSYLHFFKWDAVLFNLSVIADV